MSIALEVDKRYSENWVESRPTVEFHVEVISFYTCMVHRTHGVTSGSPTESVQLKEIENAKN